MQKATCSVENCAAAAQRMRNELFTHNDLDRLAGQEAS